MSCKWEILWDMMMEFLSCSRVNFRMVHDGMVNFRMMNFRMVHDGMVNDEL